MLVPAVCRLHFDIGISSSCGLSAGELPSGHLCNRSCLREQVCKLHTWLLLRWWASSDGYKTGLPRRVHHLRSGFCLQCPVRVRSRLLSCRHLQQLHRLPQRLLQAECWQWGRMHAVCCWQHHLRHRSGSPIIMHT
ncbi:unnamed protein product [Symbiodinium sp. KB8]|nr:unnamed protein product [Symbiodinium sp. KB8]